MSHQYKGVFLLWISSETHSEKMFHVSASGQSGAEADPTEEQIRLFFGSEEHSDGAKVKVSPGYIELTEDGTLLVRVY